MQYAATYMGSLGFAKCHWCQKIGWNYYIPDGVDAPLCEQCLFDDDKWDQYYLEEPQLEPDSEPECEPPIKKRHIENKPLKGT